MGAGGVFVGFGAALAGPTPEPVIITAAKSKTVMTIETKLACFRVFFMIYPFLLLVSDEDRTVASNYKNNLRALRVRVVYGYRHLTVGIDRYMKQNSNHQIAIRPWADEMKDPHRMFD